MSYAVNALDNDPRSVFTTRGDMSTELVWRGVLPLALCPGVNRLKEMPTFMRTRMRREALQLLAFQHGPKRKEPLPGRPIINVVRFSSKPPDVDNASSKVIVDKLTAARGGLGLIKDDSPKFCALHCSWEPAPPKKGFVYVELRQSRE